MGIEALRDKTTHYLKKLLATTIRSTVEQIDATELMEKYGIDSIMVMDLTNQLEKVFGSLPKTLFFEYRTIRELSEYFVLEHEAKLVGLLGGESSPRPAQAATAADAGNHITATPSLSRSRRQRARFFPAGKEAQQDHSLQSMDIAIIGLAGRYPKAKNIGEFWEALRDGKDCITEIPPERWDHHLYFDPVKDKAGKTYAKWGGFIDGVDKFDPAFFNISPREAEFLDPQEKLFLQCVYETVEDAGYTRESLAAYEKDGLSGNVGVYVGVMYSEYQLYGAQETALGRPIALSGSLASIANRASYFFNLHGPSMTVDTMCSSSLSAIHLACQSLRQEECAMAIAGGVNVSIHPNKYLMLAQGHFAASNGRCVSFGAGGDGYVPGEGVGAVLLKLKSKAIADGDHIYGIIKSTTVNHGGKTNGYSVPNPGAQAGVIRRAFKQARIDPRNISYLEAHGTGTSLGDPIEISALTKAFQEWTRDERFCAIGSVKSNIGHCESAAGIAAVTKVLLQLKHRALVPSLHSATLNPNIDFEHSPFVVQQELAEWRRPVREVNGECIELPRLAGISSFGAGGSNAHIVIEEYVPQERYRPAKTVSDSEPALIVLSAKDKDRLHAFAQKMLACVRANQWTNDDLADVAYTLQVGREAMDERLAFTAASLQEMEQKLSVFCEGGDDDDSLWRGHAKHDKKHLAGLTSDEDMRATIDAWIAKSKFAQLLGLWVKGWNLDWSQFYSGERPRRISLPTYPFAEERYWVPANRGGDGAIGSRDVQDLREMRLLRKNWAPSNRTPTRAIKGKIAILSSRSTGNLALLVSSRFVAADIIQVEELAGAGSRLETSWDSYGGVIDLVGCGNEAPDALEWITWLQGIVEKGSREGITLLCVTKGLEGFGNASINLAGATRAGLYRMLQSEYRHLASRHVDVDSDAEDAVCAGQIADELLIEADEAEVCYREGRRHVAFLDTAGNDSQATPVLEFPNDQVLLVTGGTRGLGYLCARHFVERYGVKRIALAGREEMPPREAWPSFAGIDTPLAQKVRAVQALEEKGVEVKVLSVSLSDLHALRRSIEDINRTMGPVGGVIHCAGISDRENPAFIRKPLDGIRRVLEPKVAGLNALLASVKEQPLQFFLLYSSVSSAIPALGSGQSDYAAANAYMDYAALAHHRNLPIVSIQWPSWSETGMGPVQSPAYARTGLLGLSNADGLDLLDRILAGSYGPAVLPALVDPAVFKPQELMLRIADRPAVSRNAAPTVHPQPVREQMPGQTLSAAVQDIRQWVTGLIADQLRLDVSKLDPDTPFPDYGADSVLLAQILGTMNKQLDTELEPSVLIEHSTISMLSAWLARHHGERMSKLLAPDRRTGSATADQYKEEDKSAEPGAMPIEPSLQPGPLVPAGGVSVTPQAVNPQRAREPESLDIAVVGLACRFPGAANLDEYWRLLAEGRSAIRKVPKERWNANAENFAGVLDDINLFDPGFFLISPEDAAAMDPQALLLLEESMNTLCHAGYSLGTVKGKAVGVYIGARSRHQPSEARLRATRNPIVALGQNYLAANVSQFFDLRGPSLVIDTACSSALVGMDMAIQALREGNIEAALVGGVSLLDGDGAHRLFMQRNILGGSEFHIFDKRANGIVLGEGIGMVLIKTLARAIEDGDQIHCVIKGMAVNNDGRTAGPATPNPQAQKQVLQKALERSGKTPADISYIDVNGSGSEVTDLLELKAIQSVYRSGIEQRLWLGSMKPNIGHPLSAEGIASFIKVVLCLKYGKLVPFLSAIESMTHYDLASSPFEFARKPCDWPTETATAAINCFADGGTNVHVILDAWQEHRALAGLRQPIAPPPLHRVDVRAGKQPQAKRSDAPGHVIRKTEQHHVNIWKQAIAEIE
jgi:polyketide synthase PksN